MRLFGLTSSVVGVALVACAREVPDRSRAVTESAAGMEAVGVGASSMAGMTMPQDSTGAVAADHRGMPGMDAAGGGGTRGMSGMSGMHTGSTPSKQPMAAMRDMPGMRGHAGTSGMPGMPGMPGMRGMPETPGKRQMPEMRGTGEKAMPRDAGEEKLARLVALLLRDSVVLRRIETDSALHARWNEVARRLLTSLPE